MSSQGFSALEKNAMICPQWALLPIQSGKTDYNAICRDSNLKKMRQTARTICSGLPPHPTRSLSRIVCRGLQGPKGSKGTLRPDFQANIRPRIF